MATNKTRFTIKKFEGDSAWSYAVFRKAEVKGIRGVVFWEQARPIVCGLSRREAQYERMALEAEEK